MQKSPLSMRGFHFQLFLVVRNGSCLTVRNSTRTAADRLPKSESPGGTTDSPVQVHDEIQVKGNIGIAESTTAANGPLLFPAALKNAQAIL